MRDLGLQGLAGQGLEAHDDRRRQLTDPPTSSTGTSQRVGAEPALGRGSDLRQDAHGLGLRRVRHRRLLPLSSAGRSRRRCAPTSPSTPLRWRSGPAAEDQARRPDPSLGPGRSISLHSLHRTARRGRPVDRSEPRRLVRQRAGRELQRALQGRAHPPRGPGGDSTTSSGPRSPTSTGSTTAAPRRDRHDPAGRVRSQLLPSEHPGRDGRFPNQRVSMKPGAVQADCVDALDIGPTELTQAKK